MNISQTQRLHQNKKLLLTSTVILLCLLLSAFFPTDNAVETISRSLIFLIALPLLYIKLILKNNISLWGWNLQNKKSGLIWGLLAFLLGAVIFYPLTHWTVFVQNYSIDPLVASSFWFFVLYELVFFNIFFFAQTFFYQGFAIYAFRRFGAWSIAIQAGIYFAVLGLSGSFTWQSAPLIFWALAGGFAAYKSRSFAYSYIFGLSFIIMLDAWMIHLVK
ncbi:MAG: hypothetical protein P4L62_00300 [Candidatus Pacebacteria bacterium]|nr:hypothetical protein [Candidatus Paceibacterota bacterium]MDR3582790.1 hypothetical protein [Candidatus Paceibacterota bacterium]